MNDSGVYECEARNDVGVGKSEYLLTVTEVSRQTSSMDNQLLIILGVSAGALIVLLIAIVLLVNRYHRNRNKKLERELSEKTEEINSFSRQASLRRFNSVEDYAMLRVDSRMKNSEMSLERPIYKGSQSTLGGKWGCAGEVEVDELGRPIVWHSGRESLRGAQVDGEKEERRRRVESYLKSSNMSLDSGLPSSLVPLKAQQEDGAGPREPHVAHLREGDSPPKEEWAPDQGAEEEPDGGIDDDDSSSYQISEALTNHFYYSNGVLRPKPHSNAILLPPKAQVI